MAQEINSIINNLTSLKPKVEKLSKNSELISIIDNLNDLISEAESFGGAIKQLVPVQLKAQVDALTGIYNQLKTISKSASQTIDGIIDNVDSIPIGQLRKKSLKSIADDEDFDFSPENEYIDTTPDTSLGAQSAIKNESATLKDFYRNNFKENKAMRSSSKFSWDNIKADFEESDNDLGALENAIKENKSFAPVDQLGDIFNKLTEEAESAAEEAVNDDDMEYEDFEESTAKIKESGFNWKKMAESAGADMLRGIMESSSIQSGANIDLSNAQDVFGDILGKKRG